MRATVLISADLAAMGVAGRSLADHWAFVGALAGLEVDARAPSDVADASLIVDGRHAALAPGSLAGLAARPDGALLSPAGDVVAAIVGPSQATLAERLAEAVDVEAVVSPSEGLRIDEEAGAVEAIVRARWLAILASRGVRFVDPARTIVDTTVEIAPGAVIWPGAILRGRTRVADAEIQAGVWLQDTLVASQAVVLPYCVCEGADIGPGAHVGPFAHLRKGAVLEADTKVGNFVEVKAAILRKGAKASHLTYLGDAEVGPAANIGAGTITCNYDGFGKYRTAIGAGAFIGSNTALVAPVSVGAGAIVGAGSVVDRDVPDEALFVERAVPTLKEGRATALRERNRQRAGKK